jgi:hypothetical protein
MDVLSVWCFRLTNYPFSYSVFFDHKLFQREQCDVMGINGAVAHPQPLKLVDRTEKKRDRSEY